MSIKVIIDRDLEPLNTQQITLKNEFTKYKELSLAKGTRNFITPPIGIQMVEPSVHLSFGRDTEFEEPPHFINDIHECNLTKVHVDTRSTWLPHRAQWDCTSNESIVYSGFIMPDGTYCLVIIDFLVDQGGSDTTDEFDAHNSYEDDDIEHFLAVAEDNQEEQLNQFNESNKQ